MAVTGTPLRHVCVSHFTWVQHMYINGIPLITSLVYVFLKQIMKNHSAFPLEKRPHLLL